VACIKWEDAARQPTMSGGGVSSWTYLANQNNGAYLDVAVGLSSGNTGALTATYSTTRGGGGTTTSWTKLGVVWFTGCDTVTPVDTSGGATGNSGTHSVAALTNSVADAVYVLASAVNSSGGFSAWTFSGTGGTEDLDDSDTLGVGHLIVSSAAS